VHLGDQHGVAEGDELGLDGDVRQVLDGARPADQAAAVADEPRDLVAGGVAAEDAVDGVLGRDGRTST
jgi:hypothetical protein